MLILYFKVVTSGAFFVEPLCTKKKNRTCLIILFFCISVFSYASCLFYPLLYTLLFLSNLFFPFLSFSHISPTFFTTTWVLSLYLFFFSPILYCLLSSLYYFYLCLLSFPISLFFSLLRLCHFVIWCFMGCLNCRSYSFLLSPTLLKDSLVFWKLCFFLHWLNTLGYSVEKSSTETQIMQWNTWIYLTA